MFKTVLIFILFLSFYSYPQDLAAQNLNVCIDAHMACRASLFAVTSVNLARDKGSLLCQLPGRGLDTEGNEVGVLDELYACTGRSTDLDGCTSITDIPYCRVKCFVGLVEFDTEEQELSDPADFRTWISMVRTTCRTEMSAF